MYACTYETGGSFRGVCALSDQACISSDLPYRLTISGSIHASPVST